MATTPNDARKTTVVIIPFDGGYLHLVSMSSRWKVALLTKKRTTSATKMTADIRRRLNGSTETMPDSPSTKIATSGRTTRLLSCWAALTSLTRENITTLNWTLRTQSRGTVTRRPDYGAFQRVVSVVSLQRLGNLCGNCLNHNRGAQ